MPPNLACLGGQLVSCPMAHTGHAEQQLPYFVCQIKVFFHGCPANFCFVVEPFGAEKMAPMTKISMKSNVIERQKLFEAIRSFFGPL